MDKSRQLDQYNPMFTRRAFAFKYKRISSSVIGYLLAIDFAFIISPAFSLFLQVLVLAFLKSKSKVLHLNFILILSIFLGILNTTKTPESDMLNYLSWFDLASTMGFGEYIWMHGKEPAYHALAYLFHFMSGGSQYVFLVGVTAVGYFLILSSLFRLALAAQLAPIVLLALVLGVSFFPQLFSISAHLTRQFLAAALLLFFLVGNIVDGRKRWVALILAILTHSSAAFFVPFLLFPALYRRPNLPIVIAGFAGLSTMLLITPIVAGWLVTTDISLLSYIAHRALQGEYYSGEPFSWMIYLLIGGGVGVVLYKTYLNKILPQSVSRKGCYLSFSLFIILSEFIILSSFSETSNHLALRFSFYLYMLLPVVVVIAAYRQPVASPISLLIIIFIPVYFLFKLEYGHWEYNDYLITMISPVFYSP